MRLTTSTYQVRMSEQRFARRAPWYSLIAHLTTHFAKRMNCADQGFKTAFEILRHVQPMLFIDIQSFQDTWQITIDRPSFILPDLRPVQSTNSR